MAWEPRRGRLYYYHKRRNGRAVLSEYIGAGPGAQLMALMDRAGQEERQSEHSRWMEQRARLMELNAQAMVFDSTVRAVLSAVLLTSGFRPHKGQWRKKRNAE